jgi:hypothetical protein
VLLSKKKPRTPGTPQMKITPAIVTIWLIKSTKKNSGKLSNINESVVLALSK